MQMISRPNAQLFITNYNEMTEHKFPGKNMCQSFDDFQS